MTKGKTIRQGSRPCGNGRAEEVIVDRNECDLSVGHELLGFVPLFCSHRRLSTREAQIIQLLLRREKNTTIARRLGISSQTVRFHLKSIYRKLGASDRVDLLMEFFAFCWEERNSTTTTPKGSSR